jgi:hypothetical protein
VKVEEKEEGAEVCSILYPVLVASFFSTSSTQARHAIQENGVVLALPMIGRWLSEYRKANQAMRSPNVRLSNRKAEQQEIGRDKIYACEKIGRWVKELLETIFS